MQLGFYDAEKVFRVYRRKFSLECFYIECFLNRRGFSFEAEPQSDEKKLPELPTH